jgi:acyl-CoA thioester hydrolase
MGTFYNSRALEWFECGRTELLRSLRLPYAVIEAHVEYCGRARYDDLLQMTSRGSLVGKARLRVDVDVVQSSGGAPVACGYTIHAVTDPTGKPIRPPPWLAELFANGVKDERRR